MRYLLSFSSESSRSPLYTESMLKALHRLIPRCTPLELRIETIDSGVGLSAVCPDELKRPFLEELNDAYPGSTVRCLSDVGSEGKPRTLVQSLRLAPDVLALKTYDQTEDYLNREYADPVIGILSAIRSGRGGAMHCCLSLCLRPATRARMRSARKIAAHLQTGFRYALIADFYATFSTSPALLHRMAARFLLLLFGRKKTLPPVGSSKTAEQLFECWLEVKVSAPQNAEKKARMKLKLISSSLGRFLCENIDIRVSRISKRSRVGARRGFLLSAREIASIWHPPTVASDAVSRLHRTEFREMQPPTRFPSKEREGDGVTVLGRVSYRGQRGLVSLALDDLRRHLLVIGKTGCGKSTFLFNVVLQQILQERSVILIDPHGQLADELLDFIPKSRTNDVCLFDAAERDFPVGFNPLIGPPGSDPVLVADNVLTSFKKVFGFDETTAPRLLHIFRNSLLTLIGTPAATLPAVSRLLTDANFRRSAIARVENDVVKRFWLDEFGRWNERDRTQFIASLQNKLGAFLSNERLHRILSGGGNSLNLREVMDGGRILICNLSKGKVGHDASTLLGSLLLSSIHLAAMSRADVPETERVDCVVVVDEFHSYLSEGNTQMAEALAESRKYKTSYVLSTQLLEQLDSATLAGVLGNCGSTLCMTVGPRDAKVLMELLGSGLAERDLMTIPKYHGYAQLLCNGMPSRAFSMATLRPPPNRSPRRNIVRKVSRERYGQTTVKPHCER